MDLAGLIDMEYFWWVVMRVMAFGIVFLVIFIAISAVGWILNALIGAFKKMRD